MRWPRVIKSQFCRNTALFRCLMFGNTSYLSNIQILHLSWRKNIFIRSNTYQNCFRVKLLLSFLIGCFMTSCDTPEQSSLHTYCDAVYNCGYISSTGEIVIPAQFKRVLPFNESTGLGVVKTAYKWRYINKDGILLSVPKYPTQRNIIGKIHVKYYKGKGGVFGANGERLNPIDFDQVKLPKLDGNPIRVKKGKKWGLLNKSGDAITSFLYDFIYDFEIGGTAVVKLKDADNKNKFGVINQFGEIIIPVKYDGLSGFGSYGVNDAEPSIAILNDKYGFVNRRGEMVIPTQFDHAQRFKNGRAVVQLNGKKGLIDTTGKIVVPIKFDELWHFGVDSVHIKLNGKWGYMDINGQMIISPRFDKSGGILTEDRPARTYVRSKWGYMDHTGKMVIPALYDVALDFKDNARAPVKLNGKWGLIDHTGRLIISNEFDSFKVYGDVVRVSKKGKSGIIDLVGNVLIPIEYEEVVGFNEIGTYRAKKNGKWGLIQVDGEVVLPFEFDEIKLQSEDGLITVTKENNEGLVDKNGKVIVPIIFDKAKPFRVEWDGKSYPIKQDGTPIGFSYAEIDRKPVVQ